MEFGYLQIACGPYRVLIPGENIQQIDPGALSLRQGPGWRRIGRMAVLDGRALLGLPGGQMSSPVAVIWRGGGRMAMLLVDQVVGLRGGFDAEFLPLPRVTPGFQALFDRIVYDRDGGFLLCLRRDAPEILSDWPGRRRFCRAVTGSVAPFWSEASQQGEERE
jgi:hypothetical protein